jgi:hypothetical protein
VVDALARTDLGHVTVHVWLCRFCWESLGRPDFVTIGAALCQGCGRSAGWVSVRWVTIKLPKVADVG